MKIYFAGAETMSAKLWSLATGEAKNVFLSYYHMKTKGSGSFQQAKTLNTYKKLGMRSVIDSGAFTFMAEAKRKGKKAVPYTELDDYFRKYVEWVEKYWSLVTDCVELDLQRVIGMEKVWRWRRIFQERGLLRKIWLVHHSCDEREHFDKIVEMAKIENGGSGHIGIEGQNMIKERPFDYNAMSRHAYENGVCIHAFASTRTKFLSINPLTSSDSSTWLQASKYACLQIYDPIYGGVKNRPIVRGRGSNIRGTGNIEVAARAWMKKYVCDVPEEERIRGTEQLQVEAIRAFQKMEDDIRELWESRGIVWRKVEERIMNERARIGDGW